MIVVDDHFVAGRLAAGTLGPVDGGVATTCSWWWRLASAVTGSRTGALSRHLARLDVSDRDALVHAVRVLPSRLIVPDIRELIPAMAALSGQYSLNQLAAEAIVAAEVLGAELVVAVDTPKIRDTAAARGLAYRLAGSAG
ncbi:MAG: hypothetical protein ACRD0L_16745 [Acidimicrobiales bacterium]